MTNQTPKNYQRSTGWKLLGAGCLALLSVAGLGGVNGCAALQHPTERGREFLNTHGFNELPMQGDTLAAIALPGSSPSPSSSTGANIRWLTVFIEGDGASWPLPWQPPSDPTPSKPIGMQLAAEHRSSLAQKVAGRGGAAEEAIAYLGRPCQYLSADALSRCPLTAWTLGRFGDAPLAQLAAQLDALKARTPAAKLRLVGYSGGGAAAVLLASDRSDVACLVTVASPLDTDAWTATKQVSRLSQSRNPLDAAGKLRGLPATHFAGAQDAVVPSGVNQRFFDASQSRETRLDGFDHESPWVKSWPQLARQSCLG